MNQEIVQLSAKVTDLIRRHRALVQEHATLLKRYDRLQGKYEQKGVKITEMQKQLVAAKASEAMPQMEDKTELKEYLAGVLEQIDYNIKLLS